MTSKTNCETCSHLRLKNGIIYCDWRREYLWNGFAMKAYSQDCKGYERQKPKEKK